MAAPCADAGFDISAGVNNTGNVTTRVASAILHRFRTAQSLRSVAIGTRAEMVPGTSGYSWPNDCWGRDR
jgi:hypothetical protein